METVLGRKLSPGEIKEIMGRLAVGLAGPVDDQSANRLSITTTGISERPGDVDSLDLPDLVSSAPAHRQAVFEPMRTQLRNRGQGRHFASPTRPRPIGRGNYVCDMSVILVCLSVCVPHKLVHFTFLHSD